MNRTTNSSVKIKPCCYRIVVLYYLLYIVYIIVYISIDRASSVSDWEVGVSFMNGLPVIWSKMAEIKLILCIPLRLKQSDTFRYYSILALLSLFW